jgi:GT2 family glycosyltransferase
MRTDADPLVRHICGEIPRPDAYDADIIILALNRISETIRAVQSALSQEGGHFHVFVLDQGSEAGQFEKLAAFLAGQARLTFLATKQNLGVGGGRNRLTGLGHGSLIVALDNDAVFGSRDSIVRAMQAFDSEPRLGALAFNILDKHGLNADQSSWGYPQPLLQHYKGQFTTTTFIGAGHAIRRSTWEEVGGYDESLFFTWEEYDFCLRAIALKWLIKYDGGIPIRHDVAPEARVSWSQARTHYFVRNRLIIERKWGTHWVNLLPRIAGYALRGVLSARLNPTISGIIAAVRISQHPAYSMTPAMRDYIFVNETQYRGNWWTRLRYEIVWSRAGKKTLTS